MVLEYAKIVFPFRTIAFLSLYIAINTVFYDREDIARKYVVAGTQQAVLSAPGLPDRLTSVATNVTGYPEFVAYRDMIFTWSIVADVFIVFLFVTLLLGMVTTRAHVSFFMGVLHFIALILITHMVEKNASGDFLICAVVFGLILPALVEIWNILGIVVFKAYYYVPK